MRGIAEILVLEKLEAELGGELKIQQFFDLIVGTRLVDESSMPHFDVNGSCPEFTS
jgi:hypothetical protein